MSISIDVDVRRVLYNLELLRNDAKDKLICAVVKADAYGHGASEITKNLDPYVDYFAVATPDEGEELRSCGIVKPILILSFLESDAELCVKNNLTVGITDESQLDSIEAISNSLSIPASVHIQVDSGMHRFGVRSVEQLVGLLDKVRGNVTVTGVYSHIYSTQSYLAQVAFFKKYEEIVKERFPLALSHISSSAYAQGGKCYGDMIRPGLSLYGYPREKFLPAMRIRSKVLNVLDLEQNSPSGYDGIFRSGTNGTRLAIIEGGYADGVLRSRRGVGSVLYKGELLRIVAVCMDSVAVDARNVDICRGDEVLFVGECCDVKYYFDDIAKETGTIPYELMTNTGKRARRYYVDF